MKMTLDLKNQLKSFQNFDLMVFCFFLKRNILKQRLVDLVMIVMQCTRKIKSRI
jgi:hypothetical protein